MVDFLKRIFGFIKQNPPILYSLFLIIFLPLILWGNAVFVIKSFEKNIDFILQDKALTIENIFGEFILEKHQDSKFLQEQIKKITTQAPEIKDLKIIVHQDDKFKIIASSNPKEVNQEIKDPSLSLAWDQEHNITHLTGAKEERFWKTVKLFKDNEGRKIFLISLNLSLTSVDNLIKQTAQISYLFVFIAILFTLFLIFQHTRLFRYLELYQELQRVEKIKDNFFRMAIHELQSPITNIRAYIEALEEELKNKILPQQLEDLKRISFSAKNLSELIEDIFKVVKIEEELLDLTTQEISPTKSINEIIDSFQGRFKAKELKLKYQRGKEDWIIKVNPYRFREILINLIDNAIKYTPQGEIEVKEWIDSSKKRYYISLKDTGIGISGEEQKNIFQKFYRVKNKETAEISGTGLGLWIVKALCEGMKGSITLESIKGIGTKFVLSFPLLRP